MAKVSNEKKLEAVKKWLKENGIEFEENHKTKTGLLIDLWVPKLFIAVHVGDDPESMFYKMTYRWAKPFFIRESETVEFVLEKIGNCCYDQMLLMQRRWQNEQKGKKG